jgi:phage terminase small subunit
MKDDNRPTLTLIASGGENIGKGRRSGNKTASGLTAKQEAFALGLVNGLSNADAYRQAYDTSGMKPGTIHNEACKLAALPHIAARVDQLIREKQARNSMFTDKQREKHSDRIWRRLWELCDAPETPPAVKASLLSLGAKAAGMLTEQVRVENITADSKSIEAEILERLQRLSA